MSTGNELVTLKQVDNYYKDLRKRSAPVIFNTAIGNPAVFSDGADGLPIQSLKVHLLPRQEGDGDPSPENIRSIVPWNGVDIFGGGKNLLNPVWWADIADNKSFVKYENGTLVYQANTYKASDYVSVIGNIEYTIHAAMHGQSSGGIAFYDSSKQYVSGIQINKTGTDHTFTTPSNAAYMRFWDNGGEMPWNEVMLVYGSTIPTTYEPYKPIIETDIEFPSNFYAGVLELETGKLWGTHKRELLNDANAWVQGTEYISYSNHSFDDRKKGNSWTGQCSAFVIQQGVASGTPFARWGGADAGNFIISSNGSGLTVADVQTLAQNDQLELVYELAEPVLIATLTPTQLQSLLGNNTIWSDANGNIEVEYRADTGLFLKQNTVKDVQVNGSSVLNDGVANVPMANGSTPGVMKVGDGGTGVTLNANNVLRTLQAYTYHIKAGTDAYRPLTPETQHTAAFYALAKLAGADMAQSSNPVGQFTDAAKVAIQKLFGFDGIFGDYELSTTASKAYAIGETFIFNGNRYRVTSAIAINDVIAPGTNCELDPIDEHYVKDTDIATRDRAGVVKIQPSEGLAIYDSSKILYVNCADSNTIKAEESYTRAIVPRYQHAAVFYGLAKAAGEDMKTSSNPVGTYTQEAKAAIQTMLGIEADIPLVETVTGATASITGMPNVRYICDTAISELTITPPASGSIVVRFTAGSNCIVSLPQTVKLPVWFDISSLEAGTTYEIIITDGVYGGVMSWA